MYLISLFISKTFVLANLKNVLVLLLNLGFGIKNWQFVCEDGVFEVSGVNACEENVINATWVVIS